MKVYFIGAGPGDPELITRKGWRILRQSPIIFFTGSLVPRTLLPNNDDRKNIEIIDSAGMTLEEISAVFSRAKLKNNDVARLHTGDPMIFGSIAEQIRNLEKMGIEYEIIPGVSSFSAAAASLKKELTLPELSQTIILTRAEGRTKMPPLEKLADLAKHHSTLVLFLSINLLKKVCQEIIPILGEDWPIAIVAKASISQQEKILQGTLGNIIGQWQQSDIRSQAIIIIGQILESKDFANSRLYDKNFSHSYRRKK